MFKDFLIDSGYPEKMLDTVLKNKSDYIYRFRFKGKWQYAPRWELKILQKILKEYLQKEYLNNYFSDNATAYIKNKNISYNLERHQGNNYFFTSDFKNFFPSICKTECINVIKNNFPQENIPLISNILFYKNQLQFGFPTSPIVSNIFMKEFDIKLYNKLKEQFKDIDIQYTRYSDDITISAKYAMDKQLIKKTINDLVTNEYPFLKINKQKTRYFERYSKKPYITGLIPLKDRTSIGKKKLNKLRLNIYLLINNIEIKNKNYFKKSIQLKSYLSYLYLIDLHNYLRLKDYFKIKYEDEKINKIFPK